MVGRTEHQILQSEEVTYAQLTLPRGRGRGYSPMLRSSEAEAGRRPVVRAKIDHSRSLFSGLLSPPGSARNSACFSGPLVDTGEVEEEEEERNCRSSLLVGSQSPAEYVIYSPERQGDRLLLGASARESKV